MYYVYALEDGRGYVSGEYRHSIYGDMRANYSLSDCVWLVPGTLTE